MLNIRFPTHLYLLLKEKANARGMSIAALVVMAVTAALKHGLL